MEEPSQPASICGKPREDADQLLRASRVAGDRHREAGALADLAVVDLHAHNFEAARAHLEQALAIARDVEDQALERDALTNLGLVFLGTGQVERARELLAERVAQARCDGDFFAEKLALDHLGAVHVRAGDYLQALETYGQALTLAQRAGDRHHQADLLWILAIQHAELGQKNKAIAAGRKAIALYEGIGFPNFQGLADNLRSYAQGNLANGADGLQAGQVPRSYYTGPGSAPGEPGEAGLLRMAFTAAKSLGTFLGSGMRTVAPATQQNRLKTCAACPQHTGVRCKLCGCFTSLKAWLPHETCPIGKWTD